MGSSYSAVQTEETVWKTTPFKYVEEDSYYVKLKKNNVFYRVPKNEYCDKYVQLLTSSQLCEVTLRSHIVSEVKVIPFTFTVVRTFSGPNGLQRIIVKDTNFGTSPTVYYKRGTYLPGETYTVDNATCMDTYILLT